MGHYPPMLSGAQNITDRRGLKASPRLLKQVFPLHAHDFFEIELIIDGTGTHLLNGRALPLVPGSIYLLTPTDVHEVSPITPLKHYNVMFREDFFADEFTYETLLASCGTQFCLSDRELPRLCSLFDLLIEESNRMPDPYSDSHMRSLLQCILVPLLRRTASELPQQQTSSAIRDALFYLQRRFRDPVTLEETAALVHLSPHYFCERFRLETGTCFSDYVNQLRARYAHRLLTSGTLSVTDVCFASGFRSFSTFSRAFHREFSCAPSKIRKHAL